MAFLNIAPDKWKHIIVGLVLGIAFPALVSWILPGSLLMPVLLSFAAIGFIGFGFELFSKITGYGHAEVMDAVATLAGGVIGIGIFLLLFQVIFL